MTTANERRGLMRWWWLLGPLVTLVIFGGPTLLLHLVVEDAKACFASIPERTEAALPNCHRRAHYIAPLMQLPFIGRPALRAHEELGTRMAVWRYVDAAVGDPSHEALAERFDDIKPAAYTIWEGSMRLRMDEVGPPMPVPEPGFLAFSIGDRRTLDTHAFSWTQHYTATRAMESALLEGRIERAQRLAEHYQGRPNTDLRVRVGALLCAGGQIERGIDQVLRVEAGRADDRTANFARNYGAVRVVHEACTHLGNLQAAPVPTERDAGRFDHRERIVSMRMRKLRQRFPACDLSDPLACRVHAEVNDHLEQAREVLRSDKPRRHRMALFAAIADSVTSPTVALQYGAPRNGEPDYADHIPLVPDMWLGHVDDAPFVPAKRYERAASHIADLDDASVARLVQVLFVRAAVGYATMGDLGNADRCIAKAGLEGPTLVLTRVNAALVSGDRTEARKRAAADAPRHPRLLLARAELALPDQAMARALATEALGQGQDPALIERARWLLVSLGVATHGTNLAVPPLPPRYRHAGWPSPLVNDDVRMQDLDDSLATWHAWLEDGHRRRSRYAAFRHRGDAPAGLTPLLHAGAKLGEADFSSEQTELWLDALSAFDARRFSLRQVAFARWRAAIWRGDAAAEKIWRERYRALALLSQDTKLAELYGAVRI